MTRGAMDLNEAFRRRGAAVLANRIERGQYVTHADLLRIARKNHCRGIHTEPVVGLCRPTENSWVFKATVYKSARCRGFVGYGDAHPGNVSPLIFNHAELRTAEARAANRFLRKDDPLPYARWKGLSPGVCPCPSHQPNKLGIRMAVNQSNERGQSLEGLSPRSSQSTGFPNSPESPTSVCAAGASRPRSIFDSCPWLIPKRVASSSCSILPRSSRMRFPTATKSSFAGGGRCTEVFLDTRAIFLLAHSYMNMLFSMTGRTIRDCT